jgi:FK506-binding protein 1
MGVTRDVIAEGNKTDFPRPGDTVSMHYVGTLTNGTK